MDVIAQAAGPREKKLLVADMDSTMIGQECIDELADYAGIKPQVAEITERAMQGELDFAAALRERVALLEGLGRRRDRSMPRRTDPAQSWRGDIGPDDARERRDDLLVSGGFTAFVEPVARMIGFERFEANVLEAGRRQAERDESGVSSMRRPSTRPGRSARGAGLARGE